MRKARKLLSLFLLLVFIVPFIPNNVYEVRADVVLDGIEAQLNITKESRSYVYGEEFEFNVELTGYGEGFVPADYMVEIGFIGEYEGATPDGVTALYNDETGLYESSMPFGPDGIPLVGDTYRILEIRLLNNGNWTAIKSWDIEDGFKLTVESGKITLENETATIGEGSVKGSIKIPTPLFGMARVDVRYRDMNTGEEFFSSRLYDAGEISDRRDSYPFEIEPEKAGYYEIESIVIADGRESENLRFELEPNLAYRQLKLEGTGNKFNVLEKAGVVHPKVSNVESFLAAGAVDGVGTWWAGLDIDLDKGTYGDIKYIDARWLNIDNSKYGVDTISVRLEEDETGRFVGDTQLHRFYKEGKYELLELELRNSAGEIVYWIVRKEGVSTDKEMVQYLSGGDITLGAENFVGFDPKKYELKVTPVKDVFIDGEDLKFNFSMNIPDGVVFPFKYAFVEVFGTEMDDVEFIRVEWDSVKREFNVKDFKNKRTTRYYGADVYFSNNPNEVVSGNWVEDAIRLPLLPNLNFTVKAVEDADIEDLFNKGEEVYEAIEEAIDKLDPTVPEEKAKIEVLEKVLRDIDTKAKAVEPEVAPEAPKFVFETDNLRALRIEEARDPNVKNISVEVDFKIKTPEEIKELVGEGTAIIGLYDMSLIKRVVKNDNSETVGTIANEDILEKITLRLPISKELSKKALKVVYVADDGTITELETRLVVVGEEGAETYYLQFETDHFSMYGILDVTEPGAPVDPEEPEEPVVDPEEPVVEPEEPVEEPKDPEVKPETPKEEEKVEDKEEETLPKAGSGAVWMYTLSGLALAGAGTFGLKKERK